MTKKMLIEATHSEEMRVAVINEKNELLELDYETSTKKPTKGNIYLAKVTRVEPSLQAAFVDYGGNRHGFLPFNEIHPDYFRIPMEDRKKLQEQLEQENQQSSEASEHALQGSSSNNAIEEVGNDIEGEKTPRRVSFHQKYKIQEVIFRNQIMLVQVLKEERGNKGAAVTTYLSLAGRFCVLMPNTPNAGGISRKVTDQEERQRLRAMIEAISLPEGMSLILRTAGVGHSKSDIKRDAEFLTRQWSNIRENTLESVAPALIHEEAALLKRSIRDLYNTEITDVIVEGEGAYNRVKQFFKELTPSHARRVKGYQDTTTTLFQKFRVDEQIEILSHPEVKLPSGGYLVINQTEALVAIDINSGRSTRERSIADTALRTNIEAAQEIARQVRLRDLAGIIVIDFIDMEDNRHNFQVEQTLKSAMQKDRARIQIGRISNFGLLELSRQRLRPSMLETKTTICNTCGGTGVIRSVESSALELLRAIEAEALQKPQGPIMVKVPVNVGFYVLNYKKSDLTHLEQRHSIKVILEGDVQMTPPHFIIQTQGKTQPRPAPIAAQNSAPTAPAQEEASNNVRRRGRRGGRNRGRRPEEAPDNSRKVIPIPIAKTKNAGGTVIEKKSQKSWWQRLLDT